MRVKLVKKQTNRNHWENMPIGTICEVVEKLDNYEKLDLLVNPEFPPYEGQDKAECFLEKGSWKLIV